jgi:hypothetical protein
LIVFGVLFEFPRGDIEEGGPISVHLVRLGEFIWVDWVGFVRF